MHQRTASPPSTAGAGTTRPAPPVRQPASGDGLEPHVQLLTVTPLDTHAASPEVTTLHARRSRLTLHVHSDLPSRAAGRQLYAALAATVRTLPGLRSSCWRIADGRTAARTGMVTMTVAIVVDLNVHDNGGSGSGSGSGEVVDRAHARALDAARDVLTPRLSVPAVTSWRLTGHPLPAT
jgi:hypothetical protein